MTRDEYNQLMHDAERAEAGAELARMMGHPASMARLRDKAARLRREADVGKPK